MNVPQGYHCMSWTQWHTSRGSTPVMPEIEKSNTQMTDHMILQLQVCTVFSKNK